jgi:hypothetical protein
MIVAATLLMLLKKIKIRRLNFKNHNPFVKTSQG